MATEFEDQIKKALQTQKERQKLENALIELRHTELITRLDETAKYYYLTLWNQLKIDETLETVKNVLLKDKYVSIGPQHVVFFGTPYGKVQTSTWMEARFVMDQNEQDILFRGQEQDHLSFTNVRTQDSSMWTSDKAKDRYPTLFDALSRVVNNNIPYDRQAGLHFKSAYRSIVGGEGNFLSLGIGYYNSHSGILMPSIQLDSWNKTRERTPLEQIQNNDDLNKAIVKFFQ